MRVLVHPSKHKLIIVSIAALASFLGFQALSEILKAYQLYTFFGVSWGVYFFVIFWQTFIFDLHLKKSGSITAWERSLTRALLKQTQYLEQIDHLAHYLNYLILPSVVYWSTVGLLFLNPFDFVLKQV